MEQLSFVAKLFNVSARVGGVVALAALILYVGRREGGEFFTGPDPVLFQTMIVAGIIGGCVVVIDLLKAFGAAFLLGFADHWLPDILERRNSKRIAL